MSAERMRVYHSTDSRGLEGIRASGCLFGSELLKPPGGYSGDANLTTDKEASKAFIIAYRGDGQWRRGEEPPHLVILSFGVPEGLLRHVGITHSFGCPEYSTTLTVDARDIPPEYFDNKHAGVLPMTQEQAIREQASGKRRFFMLPDDFLEGVATVEYEYRGTRYPRSLKLPSAS